MTQAAHHTPQIPTQLIQDVTALFGLPVHNVRRDIPIPGSPERAIQRVVLESERQKLWLLEKLGQSQASWRERVGELTHALAQQGAPFVHGHKQMKAGRFVAGYDGSHWQISPFITGAQLPRPDYIDHGWRGDSIGKFISGLQHAGAAIAIPKHTTPPLPEYIDTLCGTIDEREPWISKRTKTVLPHLSSLFAALPEIPLALAHGDVHPLNIIWGTTAIKGVIDWEFAGEKNILYDAANCIGCVGFEHPDWLLKGLVPALVKSLTEAGVFDSGAGKWLPLMTLAMRFAWLSEWLRKDDREMIAMELDYMDILVQKHTELTRRWGL